MAASKKPPVSDFESRDLLQGHEEHEKSITDLEERMSKVEVYFNSPQAFAEFFKQALSDSRSVERVFADTFCRLLKENSDVMACVDAKIHAADRNCVSAFFKRFRGWIGGISLIIFGTLLREFVVFVSSFFKNGF